MTCCVCIEPFTKQPHKKQAKCPYCDVSACTSCTQKYLESVHEDPHCMGCRRAWSREVMDETLLTTWINGDYKKHREVILTDRERSRLPAAQIIVERRKEATERYKIRDGIMAKISELDAELRTLRNQFYLENRRIELLYRGEDPDASKDKQEERRVFVMPCPSSDCRGFLSQAYKCGVCEVFVCPDCREVKGLQRDGEHTCNADTVATVQKMKKECRPCPECGSSIFKIEGCFQKDTPILLWNGTTKMSQDIKSGDTLVGDDGKQRIVESLVSGEDMLYEIKQNKGESYVVNSKHTLVLKYSGDKSIHQTDTGIKVQWFDRNEKRNRTKLFKYSENKETALENAKKFIDISLNFPEEIELLIDEYMKLDTWTKRNMMGYKSSNGIHYEPVSVELDPYILGLWLGDGTHSHPIIASNDYEIQMYLLNWCSVNKCELIHDETYKFRIRGIGATNGKNEDRTPIGKGSSNACRGCETRKMTICDTIIEDTSNNTVSKTNPFIDSLKKYSLLNNKHIPSDYLMNSRSVRLNVLAGLIDTDGHVSKEHEGKRVTINQVNKGLVNNIILLARSLGFVVNTTEKERKQESIFGGEPKDYSNIYIINISGEKLDEIPTLLPRKKCVGTVSNKDYFRTSIEVIPKSIGKYYGWTVDGNNKFLHQDFTVLHNCDQMFCTACNTPFSWLSGKKITSGAIHNPHYFQYIRQVEGGQARTPGDIPCLAHLPAAWSFDREVTRRFAKPGNLTAKLLYDGLLILTHIHAVEIPQVTNRAEDQDNTEVNIRYLIKQIDDTRWKQLLQQKEKKRLKKDEIRMRYEAFVGACVDIFGNLMNVSRAITTPSDPDIYKIGVLMTKTSEQFLRMIDIFNEGMLEISKRYKCQVITINKLTMKRERKRYSTGRKTTPKRKRIKTTDAVLQEDESDTDESIEGTENEIVQII